MVVIQELRYRVAAEALVAIRERLRGKIPPGHPLSAKTYTIQMIDVDDAYGAREGLVTQGDQLPWASVVRLYDLATLGFRVHTQTPGHHQGTCPTCEDSSTWTVQLADAVKARRQRARTCEPEDQARIHRPVITETPRGEEI
jgi:hypothetical protein